MATITLVCIAAFIYLVFHDDFLSSDIPKRTYLFGQTQLIDDVKELIAQL